LFLIGSQGFSQQQNKTDTLEFWTLYTSGDFINENAHRFTVKSWPFIYVSKAGDAFDDELAEEVIRHNDQLWKVLTQNGYKDPEKDYYAEYEKERTRIEIAQKLIVNDSRFQQLNERLKTAQRMNYIQLSKNSNKLYVFEIYSFDLSDLSKDQLFELRLAANIYTGKVKKR